MKKSTLLKKIRALIENPARWTKEVYARSADGREVTTGSPLACRFCVYGAAMKIAGTGGIVAEYLYDPITLNDEDGHDAVMIGLDFAILAAQDEEREAAKVVA